MLTYRTEAREVSLAARHRSWITPMQFMKLLSPPEIGRKNRERIDLRDSAGQ
jgi:hypothetical protein